MLNVYECAYELVTIKLKMIIFNMYPQSESKVLKEAHKLSIYLDLMNLFESMSSVAGTR